MRANELRIGNYISRPDLASGDLRIEQILELGTEKVTTTGPIKVISFYEHIKPIQLTEEWLLRFGFTHTLLNDDFKIDSWCIRIPCDWGNQLIIEAKVEEIDKGIEAYLIATHARALRVQRKYQYAHQLQNLYFVLTGEELTLKNEGL